MGPSERRAGAGLILLVLAIAFLYVGASVRGTSANGDVAQAVYFGVAAIIVAIAVVVWAAE